MNRFAEQLDRLAYEPGRNNKLRLITAYFRDTPDPDRGYALAALTGALSFKHAKPGLIRDLIMDRTDPVLFGLSYDYVGDLSETVALMWPKRADHSEQSLLGQPSPPPSPARGEGAQLSAALSPQTKSEATIETLTVPSPLAGSEVREARSRVQGEGYPTVGISDDQPRSNPPNQQIPHIRAEVLTYLRTLGNAATST